MAVGPGLPAACGRAGGGPAVPPGRVVAGHQGAGRQRPQLRLRRRVAFFRRAGRLDVVAAAAHRSARRPGAGRPGPQARPRAQHRAGSRRRRPPGPASRPVVGPGRRAPRAPDLHPLPAGPPGRPPASPAPRPPYPPRASPGPPDRRRVGPVTRRDRSRTDLLDAVLAHHTRLERLVVDLEVLADQAAASPDGQGSGEPVTELPAAAARAVRTAASRLVMAASRHEAAEERVVWPLVRDAVGRGWELVEAGVEQEQRAKRLFVTLERETTGTGRRRPAVPGPLVAEVAEAVRAHIRFEEGTVLPQLAPRLDAEQRDWMGRL